MLAVFFNQSGSTTVFNVGHKSAAARPNSMTGSNRRPRKAAKRDDKRKGEKFFFLFSVEFSMAIAAVTFTNLSEVSVGISCGRQPASQQESHVGIKRPPALSSVRENGKRGEDDSFRTKKKRKAQQQASNEWYTSIGTSRGSRKNKSP